MLFPVYHPVAHISCDSCCHLSNSKRRSRLTSVLTGFSSVCPRRVLKALNLGCDSHVVESSFAQSP